MDKLITTAAERRWHLEAYARDQWIKGHAANLPAGSWVLDAGAGASKYAPFFQHCRYETQDFCEYKGDLVKYLRPINYVCDITAIPLPSGVLDAIVCTEVIEHVVDPLPVLAEFSRLLKPEGLLLLTAPLISALHMEPYHYFGGFTHYWYEYWLPRKGFEIQSIVPVGGPTQSFISYGQTMYQAWKKKEPELPLLKRLFSRGARLAATLLLHYMLPAISVPCDLWLGTSSVCSTYMVAARRNKES